MRTSLLFVAVLGLAAPTVTASPTWPADRVLTHREQAPRARPSIEKRCG